ncbi:MAG: hypothetical protein CO023_05030 [Flavobacteriales bacterium CG_4_9_14_0_2_um_filter_35_242]|nr:hypothetical protein [Zetaproteobacteria bacterium]NDK17411.1 hypothetical protein [Flavobacteriales bacterium]OIO12001.1 MAG: hypothetical protein AUJ53_03420 [Flavobacteriaceae bacterium CG1_02_35_72]PIR13462.1 MAG: hypothetical protein COV50_05990 [Flavobacteriales bacterium CG11_big_fil_rev_8_21_14_0_20_35_7]PIV17013.1 MAG: hypothetical protein COS42_07030 [Flavobacteriales bacterium CG03_land_8_20_14_0_80_35_15]PJA06072.1 MAG: hypothetical protein COX71_03350 [Flavobacteriales bacteriu
MNQSNLKSLTIFGFLGLIGAIGVGIGEFLLHYSPNGIGYDGTNFEFFNQISSSRLTLGHFMAISFVPFYIAGYYHLFLIFKDKSPKIARAIFALGIIAFIIGGMWISSRAQLGYLVHKIAEFPDDKALQSLIEVYKVHAEILVKSLRIWILAISVLFVIPILKGETIYPKWMAIFNPIVILLLILIIYNIAPSIGFIIGPIAMNVVHFILFFLSLLFVKINSKNL